MKLSFLCLFTTTGFKVTEKWNFINREVIQQAANELELDPSKVKDPAHIKARQAARDIFILMIDAGFRINEASILQWSNIDFENGVIYH